MEYIYIYTPIKAARVACLSLVLPLPGRRICLSRFCRSMVVGSYVVCPLWYITPPSPHHLRRRPRAQQPPPHHPPPVLSSPHLRDARVPRSTQWFPLCAPTRAWSRQSLSCSASQSFCPHARSGFHSVPPRTRPAFKLRCSRIFDVSTVAAFAPAQSSSSIRPYGDPGIAVGHPVTDA